MKTVVISILGTVLDQRGKGNKRWEKWRPTVSICQHEDIIVDRLELLFETRSQNLAQVVTEDVQHISPETSVKHHSIDFENPWDFESVYATLLDFARNYPFKPTRERYLIHITTGTHVAQICLYLLTEARYLPGKLLQTSPPDRGENKAGNYQIIDLDLSKYDQIASRFNKEHEEGTSYLKSGIQTSNAAFNAMIEQLEQVSVRSSEPILLTGPTGAGKSQLAKRIFELRKLRGRISGDLVSVNCATLRGDNAMSALFGHKKGAFTGASNERPGLLKQANDGLLFLDEIGELGLDEQAMLLHAIEEKTFFPLGSDKSSSSDFQLIAGTHRDLNKEVKQGRFREDLLARIDLWTYPLPSLKNRPEDLEANIEFELEKFASKANSLVSFNKNARERFIQFAKSPAALWSGNFRDLNASITRMATLAEGGRISVNTVEQEITRLQLKWHPSKINDTQENFEALYDANVWREMDLYDKERMAAVIRTCQQSDNLAEAGRKLFDCSSQKKTSSNDSHRVRQLLSKYGLDFKRLRD